MNQELLVQEEKKKNLRINKKQKFHAKNDVKND